MSFELRTFHAPDFTSAYLLSAPDAKMAPAPADAVAPSGFHAMSIYPEYAKVNGDWLLAEESRMDCVAVLEEGRLVIREFRLLKQGDLVRNTLTEFNSSNTELLNVEQVQEKLLSLQYIREELAAWEAK